MEAEISMRMQKVTFLLCVTLDHSLILEAEVGNWGVEEEEGGRGPVLPGNGAYFPKCPLLHA